VHLTRLALTDFRSYAAVDVRLGPGVSTFTGANGQGKTNLVEAVGYLAALRSHRVSTDAPLVRQGAERAVLRATVTAAGRSNLVEMEINPGRANRIRLNRVAVPRPREVIGTVRSVLFAPEDLGLVKGDPEQRRRFLDDLLVLMRPRFAGVRADYERVIRQRTALLKSARAGTRRAGGAEAGAALDALEVWDEHLVAKGAELTAGRLDLAAALSPLVAKSYAAVSGQDAAVAMSYRMAAARASAGDGMDLGDQASRPGPGELAGVLRDALARARHAELERAVCLVGPHRDDLDMRIRGLPSRGYASQGESWSLALALRLAAHGLLRTDGDDPVLILDDVFAELDGERRERLADLVSDADQVLVTAAVEGDVPARLRGADGHRFLVAGGAVTGG